MARKQNAGRKGAVALNYNPSQGEAPKVAAKGFGGMAERIVALAKEHGRKSYVVGGGRGE